MSDDRHSEKVTTTKDRFRDPRRNSWHIFFKEKKNGSQVVWGGTRSRGRNNNNYLFNNNNNIAVAAATAFFHKSHRNAAVTLLAVPCYSRKVHRELALAREGFQSAPSR